MSIDRLIDTLRSSVPIRSDNDGNYPDPDDGFSPLAMWHVLEHEDNSVDDPLSGSAFHEPTTLADQEPHLLTQKFDLCETFDHPVFSRNVKNWNG